MTHHIELRKWLVQYQRFCPVCGRPVSIHDTLHHLFVRRMKRYEDLLWTRENIVLVCPEHHVPEAPDLNYAAALQKWTMGFTPNDIRKWIDNLPFRVKRGLPGWFIRAEEDFECHPNE